MYRAASAAGGIRIRGIHLPRPPTALLMRNPRKVTPSLIQEYTRRTQKKQRQQSDTAVLLAKKRRESKRHTAEIRAKLGHRAKNSLYFLYLQINKW